MYTDLQKFKQFLRSMNIEFATLELLDDTTHLQISDNNMSSVSYNAVDIVFNSSDGSFKEFEV